MVESNLENLNKIFDFLHKIENLKSTLRYNKTSSGRTESTAEHSWRLALITFMIADELKLDVDIIKSIKLALVHDLAEALTGDIDVVEIADGKVSSEEKNKLELDAMHKLQTTLPELIGKELFDLWNEYNSAQTNESKFIKALDKIETLTQLVESGHKFYDRPEFIANYANKYVKQFPQLTDMLQIVKRKLKKEFAKGNIEWKDEYGPLD